MGSREEKLGKNKAPTSSLDEFHDQRLTKLNHTYAKIINFCKTAKLNARNSSEQKGGMHMDDK